MMVGNNLKDGQLQQIVDKTIMEADKDGDGKLSFEEFVQMVSNTVRRPHPNSGPAHVRLTMMCVGHCQADDARGPFLDLCHAARPSSSRPTYPSQRNFPGNFSIWCLLSLSHDGPSSTSTSYPTLVSSRTRPYLATHDCVSIVPVLYQLALSLARILKLISFHWDSNPRCLPAYLSLASPAVLTTLQRKVKDRCRASSIHSTPHIYETKRQYW